MILLGILGLLALGILGGAYYCYRVAFYAPPRKPLADGEFDFPEGEIYEPYHEKMKHWITDMRSLPQEDVEITSFDGLKLRGKYFEYAPGAPIELMFHGYRGSSERDMPGGVQRCFKVGRSALIVDQRCSGRSEGKVITFGIREHRDCLAWVDFMVKKFGPDVKIILTGISMGAATVVMAAGQELPENVIGVLADCGYNSAKDIMIEVQKQMGYPPVITYPLTKLAARLFGGFDLEELSPEQAVKNCKVPVIFYHGDTDDFVPCWMSQRVYDACPSRKAFITIPGAGHGLAYAKEPQHYLATLREFFGPEASA